MPIVIESKNIKFISLWHKICISAEKEKDEWIVGLRARGFKAAHPNDGWVDRNLNEVYFAYPQFNDGIGIGSLVMLGWPWNKNSWRPVRIIGKRTTALGGMVWWQFEDVDLTNKESME